MSHDIVWLTFLHLWASQRKSTKYHQKLTLTPSGSQLNVDYVSCVSCPAGTNGARKVFTGCCCSYNFADRLNLVLYFKVPHYQEIFCGR